MFIFTIGRIRMLWLIPYKQETKTTVHFSLYHETLIKKTFTIHQEVCWRIKTSAHSNILLIHFNVLFWFVIDFNIFILYTILNQNQEEFELVFSKYLLE